MKIIHAFAFALMVIGTSGCSTIAQIATNFSSSTPAQVTTFAEATQAATLATRTVDIAVNSGKLDKPTLVEFDALNEGLHAAYVSLKADNDAGRSLAFGSFNAALAAFNAYATTKGIAH